MKTTKYSFRYRLRNTGGLWEYYKDGARLTYEEASALEDDYWDRGYETQMIATGYEDK